MCKAFVVRWESSVERIAFQSVGYNGDLGYESFLYGGEKDIRKLLLFLLDRLPKEERSAVAVGSLCKYKKTYSGITLLTTSISVFACHSY